MGVGIKEIVRTCGKILATPLPHLIITKYKSLLFYIYLAPITANKLPASILPLTVQMNSNSTLKSVSTNRRVTF